jgi:hypothetical protein
MSSKQLESKIVCPLCPQSRQEADTIPAEVVGPLQGPAVGTRRAAHRATAHRNCIIWCPEVCAGERGQLVNVDKAVARASRIKCRHCGEKGASIGCWEPRCSASYHLVCAYDPACDVDLILPDLELWCPKHAEGPTYQAYEEAKREARAAAAEELGGGFASPESSQKHRRGASAAQGASELQTPTRGADGTFEFSPRGSWRHTERIAPPSGQRPFQSGAPQYAADAADDTSSASRGTSRTQRNAALYGLGETKRKRGRPPRSLVESAPESRRRRTAFRTGVPAGGIDITVSSPGERGQTRNYHRQHLGGVHQDADAGRGWEVQKATAPPHGYQSSNLAESRSTSRYNTQRQMQSNDRQLTMVETLGRHPRSTGARVSSAQTEDSANVPETSSNSRNHSETSAAHRSDQSSDRDSEASLRGEGLEREEAEWKWELERRQKRWKRRARDQRASRIFSQILADVTAETVKERQKLFEPMSGEALQRFIREAEPYTTKVPQDYELREAIPQLLQDLPWIEARPNLHLCERDSVLYFYTRTDVWGWYSDVRTICGAGHPHTIKVITKPRPEHRLSIHLRWAVPEEPIGRMRFADPFNTQHAFRDNVLMMRWVLNGPFKRTRSCDLIAHGLCYFPELPTARLWFTLCREIIRGLKPVPVPILPYRAYIDSAQPLETPFNYSRGSARSLSFQPEGTASYQVLLAGGNGASTVATAAQPGALLTTAAGNAAYAGVGLWRSRPSRSATTTGWLGSNAVDGAFSEEARERVRRQGYGFELDDLEGADASSEEEEVLAQLVQWQAKQLELVGEFPEPEDRFWPFSENTDPCLRVLDSAWKVETQHPLELIEKRNWARMDALFHHDSDNLVILARTETQLRDKYGSAYASAVLAASAYNRELLTERQALLHQRFGERRSTLTNRRATPGGLPSEGFSSSSDTDSELDHALD